MTVGAVRVKGLHELIRGLGRADKAQRRYLQRELDSIAKKVRYKARERARDEGLVDEGKLVSGIRHRVIRTSTAVVKETRTRGGYLYPAFYEFGGRGENTVGPRAFLYPAADEARPEVVRDLEKMLDRLFADSGL